MDLMDTCKKYLKFALESFDYDEQKLENCVRFYLYKEVKRRTRFDERFSKLLKLMEEPNFQTCQERDSCKNSDELSSYARVLVEGFKEKLRNKDFSNLEIINHYFFEKFEIEIFQIEKLFQTQ